MPIQNELGMAPDHPVAQILNCHQKMMRQLDALQELSNLPTGGTPNIAQQELAAGAVRYFNSAGSFHHDDEELDLFPAIETVALEMEADEIVRELDRLRAEHAELGPAWSALCAAVAALAQGDGSQWSPPAAASFAAHYRSHIASEESKVLPFARSMLAPTTLENIRQRMASRRDKPR